MKQDFFGRKIGLTVLAVVLFMGLIALMPHSAQAANVWTVGPGGTYDFATISAAVGNTSVVSGDTLQVAAGTYTEGNITISKSLTIRGAKAGVAGKDPSRTNAAEESVWVSSASNTGPTINAQGVTIDGFTLKLTKAVATNFGGACILNNIFDATKPGSVGSGSIITLNQANETNGFTFSGNWVKSTTTPNVVVYFAGAANKTIRNFVFCDNTVDYCGAGQGYCVFFDAPNQSPAPTFKGVTIERNTVLGGATRVFNITSAEKYSIKDNLLQSTYYSVMIGGSEGEISGNTFLSASASASPPNDPIIFALATFNPAVELRDVSFYNNTVYFSNTAGSSYGILFSTSGGTVSLDTIKLNPRLVDGFTAIDNHFVYGGTPSEIHWDMQSGVSDSYKSVQKHILLQKNNFFWGANGSNASTWRRMLWSEVYVRGAFVHYDWAITFDANGGKFDATEDMSAWIYDTGTPYGLGPTAASNIGYERKGWVFDGLSPDNTRATKGIARALNDGRRNTGTVPFAAPDGSAFGGSIDAGNGSANYDYGAIPIPTKNKAVFRGWYLDKKFKTKWNPQTFCATGDTTIYARWTTENSPLPETGDAIFPRALLLMTVLVAACGGAAILLIKRRAKDVA